MVINVYHVDVDDKGGCIFCVVDSDSKAIVLCSWGHKIIVQHYSGHQDYSGEGRRGERERREGVGERGEKGWEGEERRGGRKRGEGVGGRECWGEN